MPAMYEDTRLDEDLNKLGTMWSEKAAEVAESGVDYGPHRPFVVGKEVQKVVQANLTAQFMLKQGIAQKSVRQWVEKTISPTRAGFAHGYNSPGVGGIFYEPMNPNIVNAMSLPRTGLDARLPEIPTNQDQPLYGIITGQTAVAGQSAQANDCSPWGVAGLTKICRQVSTLGRVGVSSDPLNIERMGHLVDRSDFTDYQLIGDPLQGTDQNYVPTGIPGYQGNGSGWMNNELGKLMREVDVEAIRRFAPDIYTANPASSADAFHSAFFRGLDILINTGQQDSVTQTACARADSKIINFATVSVTGNNITTNGTAASLLVDVVSDLWYVLNYEANEAGLQPVEWTFVMAPGAFREITAAWPCSYLTNRCLTASSSNPDVVMGSDQVAMREDMRKGQFLWIDAQQVPVILDAAIVETQGSTAATAGSFTSTIYLVPWTIRGRFPVLTKTYFDFNGPNAAADGLRMLGALSYGMAVSPDGKWLHNLEKTGTCFQLSSTKRPGLVLRTPYLAARITNVKYQPRLVARNWNPGTTGTAPSFYDNGGVTVGTAPSYFNPTTGG